MTDLKIKDHRVVSAVTTAGDLEADCFIIAPGHSAHETYRMMMRNGVLFRTKQFALGCRVEHLQKLINEAQWGRPTLPGVKAAEYRLTAKTSEDLPVYTFCMCPVGIIVPATPYEKTNIVNGMSYYLRNHKFSNAACVAGVNMDTLLGRKTSPEEALDFLGTLENRFYEYAHGYQAPSCRIQDFIDQKETSQTIVSSYPLGLAPAPLWELLPSPVSRAIREGLKIFARKLKGFETGAILGLESKTSAPVQAIRDEARRCAGFDNLYITGEGSGHSGGIISSAADGIRTAMRVAEISG